MIVPWSRTELLAVKQVIEDYFYVISAWVKRASNLGIFQSYIWTGWYLMLVI